MNQKMVTAILLLAVIGLTVYVVARREVGRSEEPSGPTSNVALIDGKQVIDMTAQGGYSPRKTTAKAGIPTVLRMSTENSYDCSVALRIPKLSIAKNLEPTGVTEIDLGSPQVGKMYGLCGMGMYSFEINFQS